MVRLMAVATRINNVSDARRLARRALPRAVFDYIDGGAEGEVTMEENERAFREVTFRPRMGTAVKVEPPALTTTVLGTPVSMPLLLAPCGLVKLMHPDGALGAARSARRAGTISVLSTVSGTPPEGLAGEPGSRWFQLYAADREIAGSLMRRAADSGFEGLVVTIDTPALGKRERDARHGISGSFELNLRSATRLAPQILVRPGWSLRMLRSSMKTLKRTPLPGGAPEGAVSSAGAVAMLASPFTWDDVAWIRERWNGPLVVKGVLSGEDASRSADAGADAVVVSNHGGRQLEGAPATMRVLPEIAEAVRGRVEVLLDGGVRRGGDVVKAICSGARAVLIGRPYLYTLAAGGEAGVDRILEIFRGDMARTLSLMGCHAVSELDPSWLQQSK